MPTYADATDVKAFTALPALDALADAEIDKLIIEAERDIDSAVGVHSVDPDTGLKFDVAALTTRDADSLNRATCAQVEYRFTMGAEFFVKEQYQSVSGPEFTTNGKLPHVGPKTWRELENGGLLHLTTSWSGGSSPPWDSFARNVGDEDAPDPTLRGTISTP